MCEVFTVGHHDHAYLRLVMPAWAQALAVAAWLTLGERGLHAVVYQHAVLELPNGQRMRLSGRPVHRG
jgi:hypothetical protein